MFSGRVVVSGGGNGGGSDQACVVRGGGEGGGGVMPPLRCEASQKPGAPSVDPDLKSLNLVLYHTTFIGVRECDSS